MTARSSKRVIWLADETQNPGGAELTQAEFKAAAPEGFDVEYAPPGYMHLVEDADYVVIHNCVTYSLEDLQPLENRRVTKFWHDVGPHVQPGVKDWLSEHATQVCCSPIQAEHMGLDVQCIPPPVDLSRFEHAAAQVNGNRAGQVCVGSWRNYGKAAHKVHEWAQTNGPVDFFGDGPFAPTGSQSVPYDAMPQLLAQYERFVFLPMVLEPFGRLVAEAWASGCEIVTNGLVGARYWIEQDPGAIDTAAEDFWKAVLDA